MYYDYLNMKTGDIIFVYGNTKSSRLIIAGQNVLRIHRRLFKGAPWSKYSHVMLVIDGGAVIHADGTSVRVQAIGDVLGPDVKWGSFRVVRLAGDRLTPDLAEGIATEARRFLQQRYTFGYGRSFLPKILRRGRGLTLPFCSQLVAAAYAKAGVRFGRRLDLILPSDIDQSCKQPAWLDVTFIYRRTEPKNIATLAEGWPDEAENVAVAEQLLGNFAEFQEIANRTMARNPQLTHDFVKVLFEAWRLKVDMANLHTDSAKLVESNPSLILATQRETVLTDLAQIPVLYERLASKNMMLEGESFADFIRVSFPGAAQDFSPYEGLPTLAVVEELEQISSMLIVSTLLRKLNHYLPLLAEAATNSCGRSASLPSIPVNLIVEYLSALPPIAATQNQLIIDSFQQGADREAIICLATFVLELHTSLVARRDQLTTLIQVFQFATAEERTEITRMWAGR